MDQADAHRLIERRQQELATGDHAEGVLDFEYRTDGFFTVGYNGARRYRQATLAPEEMASDRWLEILKSRLGLS